MANKRQNLRVLRTNARARFKRLIVRQVAQCTKDVSAPFGDKGSQAECCLSQETAQDAESRHHKASAGGRSSFNPGRR